MKDTIRRYGFAVAVLGTILAAGRARADLILDSGFNGGNQRGVLVYDYAAAQGENYAYSGDGSSTLALGGAIVASSNSLSVAASSTAISIATSTYSAASSTAESYASSYGSSYAATYFHVDVDGVYDVAGAADFTLSNSGAPSHFEQFAALYIYDVSGGYALYYAKYITENTGGAVQLGTLPAQVSLFSGHNYVINVQSSSVSTSDRGDGSTAGTATASITLTEAAPLATPEPSTLASAGTAALMLGAGCAWRRRKPRHAA